jgi:hypothetical protein
MSPVSSGFCLQRYAAGALCAFLLLSGSSWPASAPDAKPLTAILLIARDDLPDPDFADSIVLVMNNLGRAPVGFIINRPMSILVSRLFPDLKRLAQVRDKVYFGGPVDFGSVWFPFRAATPPEHAVQACDGVYLSADRQLLGRDKPMDSLPPNQLCRTHICASREINSSPAPGPTLNLTHAAMLAPSSLAGRLFTRIW